MIDRLLGSLFRLSTFAFPRRLRQRFEAEMGAAFQALVQDRRRQEGPRASWLLAFQAILDMLRCGLRARFLEPSQGFAPATPATTISRPSGRTTSMFDRLVSDLRYSLRTLCKEPAFSVAVILVLALGIGVNSAMFSAVRSAILAPPPFADPEGLVLLDLEFPNPDGGEPELVGWSYPKYQTLLRQPDLPLESVAGFSRRKLTLNQPGGQDALRIEAEVVSASYFSLLRTRPEVGRFFTAEDPAAGVPTPQLSAVLSHDFWQRRFGGDPAVMGEMVRLDGQPVEVIGVAEAGFLGLSGPADLWLTFSALPVLLRPRQLEMQHAHWFDLVGRMADGATLESLDARLAAAGREIDRTHPDAFFDEPIGAGARSLAVARRNPNAERSLWVLMAAAGLIVLMACGNIAALFESRADGRSHAISIRGALGASRGAIVRHVMLEACLLALGGALLGVVLARWLTQGLIHSWPETFRQGDGYLELTHLDGVEVGIPGALFAFVLAAAVSMLFGLGTAFRLSGLVRAPLRALRADTRVAGGKGVLVSRATLVCLQTALAVMLVIGAGLMLGSLARLQRVEVGAETEGLLAFRYEIGRSSAAAEQPNALHADLLARLANIPGVKGVSLGSPPLADHDSITLVKSIDGAPPVINISQPEIGVHSVSDDYFRMLGVPLLAGRTFASGDRPEAPPVVVLSRRAARELFGELDVVGRQISLGIGLTPDGVSARIIGVVDDVLYSHPAEGLMPEAYISYRQDEGRRATVLVSAEREPLMLLPAIRRAVRQADPTLPIYGVRTLNQIGNEAIGDTRLLTSLLLGCGLLALALAAVGTYGVTAYWVVGRRRELGVRIALGARNTQVQTMVMGSGLRAVAVGIVLGTLAAWASTRLLASLLFEVDRHDPATFAAGVATLLGISLLASYLPARRAAKVDPVAVLSED